MAIRSMTGYGQGKAENARFRVEASLRAVNHRYLDVHVRINSPFEHLEPAARSFLEKRLGRGKVDLALAVEALAESPYEPRLSPALAKAWWKAAEELRKDLGEKQPLPLAEILKLPGVVELRTQTCAFGEADAPLLEEALQQALRAFDGMRSAEGRALAAEMEALLEKTIRTAAHVEGMASEMTEKFREKIRSRMQEILKEMGAAPDEARLLQEAAMFAERSDVTEEIARLRSHVAQFRGILTDPEPGHHGRTLDFLLQEMQRESSTLAAKARFESLAPLLVELRAEIEKLREQARNVE